MRAKQGAAISGLIPIAETDTVASTITALQADLIQLGIMAGTYHMTPPFHSQVSKKTVVAHFGLPEVTRRKYLEPAIFQNDPIPDYVMNSGRAMSFANIIANIKLPQNQIELNKEAEALGISDAICIPLFGPNGRNSFAFLLTADNIKLNDAHFVHTIIEMHQSYHRKICILINLDSQTDIKLSKRESQVIYWIAHGKSNQDISTILDISAGTVDTYIRRLYSKLGVSDRVSAVIEAMSRGLLHI